MMGWLFDQVINWLLRLKYLRGYRVDRLVNRLFRWRYAEKGIPVQVVDRVCIIKLPVSCSFSELMIEVRDDRPGKYASYNIGLTELVHELAAYGPVESEAISATHPVISQLREKRRAEFELQTREILLGG